MIPRERLRGRGREKERGEGGEIEQVKWKGEKEKVVNGLEHAYAACSFGTSRGSLCNVNQL